MTVKNKRRLAIVIALVLSAALLLLQYYRWQIVDLITPFLQVPLEYFTYFLFFGWLAVVTFSGIKDLKERRMQRLFASGIMIFVYIVTLTVNFNSWWIDQYFKNYRGERELVLQMIERNELKPNVPHNNMLIHLPPPLDKTSMGGGDIAFDFSTENKRAFFYTFRGILDSYAGFFYSSADVPPDGDLNFDIKNRIKLMPHWYWIGDCDEAKNDALGVLLDVAPILRCR